MPGTPGSAPPPCAGPRFPPHAPLGESPLCPQPSSAFSLGIACSLKPAGPLPGMVAPSMAPSALQTGWTTLGLCWVETLGTEGAPFQRHPAVCIVCRIRVHKCMLSSPRQLLRFLALLWWRLSCLDQTRCQEEGQLSRRLPASSPQPSDGQRPAAWPMRCRQQDCGWSAHTTHTPPL